MQHEYFWWAAVVASVFVGMGKGGLPVIATLAVPTLALVISPVTAAGLLLPVYVVSDVFGLMAYRRSFDRRVLTNMSDRLPSALLQLNALRMNGPCPARVERVWQSLISHQRTT